MCIILAQTYVFAGGCCPYFLAFVHVDSITGKKVHKWLSCPRKLDPKSMIIGSLYAHTNGEFGINED